MVETTVRNQGRARDPPCGRVYATALLTMCLQVYYRYERIFK